MDKEKIINSGLIEQYVLGLVSPEEQAQVEQCAEKFPEVQTEIDALRKALESYARQHAIPPPKELKQQVLDSVGNENGEPPFGGRTFPSSAKPPGSSNFRWKIATAVLAAFCLFLGFLYFVDQKAWDMDYRALSQEFGAYRASCESQQIEFRALLDDCEFMQSENTEPVALFATAKFPASKATVFYNNIEKKAVLKIGYLPEPPSGMQYQIWADVKGEMINMGLIDKSMTHLQAVNYIQNAESFNITLEPEGGSEHPDVSKLCANGQII